ncbi:class V lanthionine synthetase subunit LxmK [Kitasatospora sp. NPDC056138]|uniref:class V lanthionine synthetase subunit LxmK n=1 Tax=Kitasatospora sp. NPDC056138 TaxID=3345724 RepID=UPI0035D6C9D9
MPSHPSTDHPPYEPAPLDAYPEVDKLLIDLGLGAFDRAGLVGHPGRNENWSGPTGNGRAVFVKKLAGRDIARRLHGMTEFDRMYRQVSEGPKPFSWRAPGLLAVQPADALAVFELLPDATMVSHRAEEPGFDPGLAARLGRAVGELHTVDWSPTAVDEPAAQETPDHEDFLDRLTVKEWQAASAGELELWALLQQDGALVAAIRALRPADATVPLVPCHRDLRLDQFLLSGDEVYLTDWEEFGPAEPAKDLGSVVGEFIYRAARRLVHDLDEELTGDPSAAHRALLEQGRAALAQARPAVRGFLAAYRSIRPDVDPVRVAAVVGWHLIDRILASARHVHQLSPLDRAQAGIGRTLLLRPERFTAAIGLEGTDG